MNAMEGFFDYVKKKYFVDYEDSEINDLIIAVQNCLAQFQTRFNCNDDCGVKISDKLPCGSMSEQTSIWLGRHNYQIWKADKDDIDESTIKMADEYRCLEFDFLAILEPLTPDMETVATCPAHAKIRSKTYNDHVTMNQLRNSKSPLPHEDDDICLENVFDRPHKIISAEFHEGIILTARTILKHNIKFQNETETGICTLRFLDTHSDTHLLFTWISKNRTNPKHIVGKIDFLPAFRSTHEHTLTFVVGKPCTGYMSMATCSTSKSCDSNCKEQCWRVSYNKEEAACIQNTSQHHRDMFRVIKVWCDTVTKHQYFSTRFLDEEFSYVFKIPTSYHTKTILLNHIEKCVSEDIRECFSEILVSMKQFTEKGLILNWKSTHHLGVEYYEIYFFFILWTIFNRDEHRALAILENSPYPLPEVIHEIILQTQSDVDKGNFCYESLERNLVNILVFPLWDYVMAAIQLSENVYMNDRCDFELERLEKIYSCTGKDIGIELEDLQPRLHKSHSENDLAILVDYFDDKHFDKNWENIFYQLKSNGDVDKSFTLEIQETEQQMDVFVAPTNPILPYDFAEKEMIIEIIKGEENYWYNRLQESFIFFSKNLDHVSSRLEN